MFKFPRFSFLVMTHVYIPSFFKNTTVISYYNPAGQPSNLRFVFHVFPLPYHYNAYAAAQGAAIVKYLAPTRIFDWIDAVYANQPAFYNEATADMTSNQVHAAFATLAAKSTGVDPSKVRVHFRTLHSRVETCLIRGLE